jgi:hypothetical protein
VRREACEFDSTVLELRQYTLREAQPEVLIDLFDQRFIEPQQLRCTNVMGRSAILMIRTALSGCADSRT